MSARAGAAPLAVRESMRGYGLLGITALVWGFNWTVSKFLLTELPPFALRGWAGMVGAGLLFAIAALRGERIMPPPGQWRRLAVSGFLNFTCWMGLASLALLWLPAGEAAIIAYTLPIWTALFAWPMLGERPTAPRLAGLVLGLSGVAVLVAGEPIALAWDRMPGVAAMLAGAIAFALGTVLAKRAPSNLPPMAGVAWQVLIGAIPLLLLGLITEHADFGALTPLGWGAFCYMGLIAMSLAYVCWFGALRRLPASTASIGALLVPVIAVFAAAAVLGEPLGPREGIALLLTLSGILLAARA